MTSAMCVSDQLWNEQNSSYFNPNANSFTVLYLLLMHENILLSKFPQRVPLGNTYSLYYILKWKVVWLHSKIWLIWYIWYLIFQSTLIAVCTVKVTAVTLLLTTMRVILNSQGQRH